MAILLGDEGSSMISALTHQVAGRGAGPVQGWAAMFGANKPSSLWATLQGTMQRTFLKKMLATQGASMLGRVVPFGIGAAVGGFGNRFLGKKVIEAAGLAFGTLPTTIPGQLVSEGERLEAMAEVEAGIEAERRRRGTSLETGEKPSAAAALATEKMTRPASEPTTVPLMRMNCRSRPTCNSIFSLVSLPSQRATVSVISDVICPR